MKGASEQKLWNGIFSNLRISKESSPELYAELAALQHTRDRGERIRFLAALGLYSLRVSGHNSVTTWISASPGEQPIAVPQETSRLEESRADLKGKLLKSV